MCNKPMSQCCGDAEHCERNQELFDVMPRYDVDDLLIDARLNHEALEVLMSIVVEDCYVELMPLISRLVEFEHYADASDDSQENRNQQAQLMQDIYALLLEKTNERYEQRIAPFND